MATINKECKGDVKERNSVRKALCRFRKGHSTQNTLLNLLKNWKKTLENSGVIATVLMNLSKTYECHPHDLLIAKLRAHGFEDSATYLISDYLFKRYQRVKIGSVFSSDLGILRGFPQGLILGPILFNTFINDLIFFIQETEVCNFVDGTTIYSYSLNYKEVTHKLSNDAHIVLNRFKANNVIGNSVKFQI